jgi:hypothetical protein
LDAPEIVRLVMVVFVLVPYVMVTRRVTGVVGKAWLDAAFYLSCASYLFNVLEDLVLKDLTVLLLLASYGAAGVCALVGVLIMRRASRSDGA